MWNIHLTVTFFTATEEDSLLEKWMYAWSFTRMGWVYVLKRAPPHFYVTLQKNIYPGVLGHLQYCARSIGAIGSGVPASNNVWRARGSPIAVNIMV